MFRYPKANVISEYFFLGLLIILKFYYNDNNDNKDILHPLHGTFL